MVHEEKLIENLRPPARGLLPPGALVILLLLAAACAPATPPAAAQALKIDIAAPGMYRLTAADLSASGLPHTDSRDALPSLRLRRNGVTVPFQVDPGNSPSIQFYAPPPDSPYSPVDVYVLDTSAGPGRTMAERAVTPATAAPPAASYSAVLKLEQDVLYSPEEIGGSHWFWQSLIAPISSTVTADLHEVVPGEAQVQVKAVGVTTGDHLLRVAVNGKPGGEARWSGRTAEAYTVQTAELREGKNEIGVEVPGAQGAVDGLYLDSITLTYPRRLVAENGSLEFVGGPDFLVDGLAGSDARLYDITNPLAPQALKGFGDGAGEAKRGIAFHDGEQGRHYLALAGDALIKPERIRPVPANDLLSNTGQADYIIIAPQSLSAALQPLVQQRQAHGLTVRVLDVDQIYDAFSNSVPDPHALRDAIRYARTHWASPAPRYLLLVGKASYDYRDNVKGANRNLVPTFLVPTPHLGDAASDDWFVSDDGDPHPAMAVGRIPARTADEVTVAVNKIAAYESASRDDAWALRAIFVADDKTASFAEMANTLAEGLPASIGRSIILLSDHKGDVDATRADIVQEWNRGALLLTYIGHGSIDTWAAGPLFSAENVGDVTNSGKLPVLVTPTCLDGFFYHPDKNSLAEDLLFSRTGGIAAGLVPTGLSMETAQNKLMDGLYDELFQKRAPTLGEAVLRAKQRMTNPDEDEREVLETFTLLGDPALAWTFPD